jgi:hypothetical protein
MVAGCLKFGVFFKATRTVVCLWILLNRFSSQLMRVALLLCLALYGLHSSVAHNRETSSRNIGCYLLLETCNYLPSCNCHHNSKGDTVEPLEALDTRHLILHSLSYKVCKTHSCTEVPGRESFYDCGD